MNDEMITVRCACGWELTGAEDDVVVATTDHGRRLHNMAPTRDEVLAMAVGRTQVHDSPVRQPVQADDSLRRHPAQGEARADQRTEDDDRKPEHARQDG